MAVPSTYLGSTAFSRSGCGSEQLKSLYFLLPTAFFFFTSSGRSIFIWLFENAYNDIAPVVLRKTFFHIHKGVFPSYILNCCCCSLGSLIGLNRVPHLVSWQPTMTRNKEFCTSGIALHLAFWGSDWRIWKALVRWK